MSGPIRKQSETTAEQTGARTFRFTISTGDVDREGDRINPHGWDLRNFEKSGGPVLWAHDVRALPIAKTTQIGVIGGALKATAEFPEGGVHPFADSVRALLAAGYLTSASVGFRAVEKAYNAQRGGWDFQHQELLEWSIVNIPALPAATVERRDVGINRAAITKWLGGAGPRGGELIQIVDDDDARIAVDAETVAAAMHEVVRRQVADEVRRQTLLAGLPIGPFGPHYVLDSGEIVTAAALKAAMATALAQTVGREVRSAVNRLTGKVD